MRKTLLSKPNVHACVHKYVCVWVCVLCIPMSGALKTSEEDNRIGRGSWRGVLCGNNI